MSLDYDTEIILSFYQVQTSLIYREKINKYKWRTWFIQWISALQKLIINNSSVSSRRRLNIWDWIKCYSNIVPYIIHSFGITSHLIVNHVEYVEQIFHFVKFENYVTFIQRKCGNTETTSSIHFKFTKPADIIFVVTQSIALCWQVLHHKTHMLIGEEKRTFVRASDFHHWPVIFDRVEADWYILGFIGPKEEDTT